MNIKKTLVKETKEQLYKMVVEDNRTKATIYSDNLNSNDLKLELWKVLTTNDTSLLNASIAATKNDISPEQALCLLKQNGFNFINTCNGINFGHILCIEDNKFFTQYGKISSF